MVAGVSSITMINWNNATVEDVGNVTEYTWADVPDSGMTLFRVGAYNAKGEAIRFDAGAWHNLDWAPPRRPGGLGAE
jgi:hypothetical protein